MNSTLRNISIALGAIMHPLMMPTYGILLFCAALSAQLGALPLAYWLIASIATFTMTAFIPLVIILIQIAQGSVADIFMRIAAQRTTVYIYALVCYLSWCYFLLKVLRAPMAMFLIAVGATIALLCVLLINLRWKISAHSTGIGGLIGGVLAYSLSTGSNPAIWLISTLLFLAWILMCSRIYLDAHTPLQTVAGLLLGLFLTYIPVACYV